VRHETEFSSVAENAGYPGSDQRDPEDPDSLDSKGNRWPD
jgi:hypothetical protein